MSLLGNVSRAVASGVSVLHELTSPTRARRTAAVTNRLFHRSVEVEQESVKTIEFTVDEREITILGPNIDDIRREEENLELHKRAIYAIQLKVIEKMTQKNWSEEKQRPIIKKLKDLHQGLKTLEEYDQIKEILQDSRSLKKLLPIDEIRDETSRLYRIERIKRALQDYFHIEKICRFATPKMFSFVKTLGVPADIEEVLRQSESVDFTSEERKILPDFLQVAIDHYETELLRTPLEDFTDVDFESFSERDLALLEQEAQGSLRAICREMKIQIKVVFPQYIR